MVHNIWLPCKNLTGQSIEI